MLTLRLIRGTLIKIQVPGSQIANQITIYTLAASLRFTFVAVCFNAGDASLLATETPVFVIDPFRTARSSNYCTIPK